MSHAEFCLRATEAVEKDQIDDLCLDWLEEAAREQTEKERNMLLSIIESVRIGIQ